MLNTKEKVYLSDLTQEIYHLIDRGDWKHSWHLPRNKKGYIDDNKALPQYVKILLSQRDDYLRQAGKTQLMLDKLSLIQKERDKQERDNIYEEWESDLREFGCVPHTIGGPSEF